MTPPLLRCEGVRVDNDKYGELRDATFCLYPGETVVITGLNSSGRGTLCNLLRGQVPRYGGQIYWDGRPVVLDSLTAVHDCRIATLSGTPTVFDTLSLQDNLTVALGQRRLLRRVERWSPGPADRVLLNALELDLAQQDVARLSRFEKNKLNIFMAFLGGARLLLFYSDFFSCTSAESAVLRRAFRALNLLGITVLLESNDVFPQFDGAVDRCLVVRRGLVTTELAPGPDGHFSESTVRHVILGRPFEKRELTPPPAPRGEPLFFSIAAPGWSVAAARGGLVGIHDRNERFPRTVKEILVFLRGARIELNGRALRLDNVNDLVRSRVAVLTRPYRDSLLFLNLSPAENAALFAHKLLESPPIYERRISEYLFESLVKRYRFFKHCRGLAHAEDCYGLSYTQLCEIEVAKWLAINPQVVLVRLPLIHYDTKNAERYKDLQLELRQDGKTLVVVSSNYEDLAPLCTEIVTI